MAEMCPWPCESPSHSFHLSNSPFKFRILYLNRTIWTAFQINSFLFPVLPKKKTKFFEWNFVKQVGRAKELSKVIVVEHGTPRTHWALFSVPSLLYLGPTIPTAFPACAFIKAVLEADSLSDWPPFPFHHRGLFKLAPNRFRACYY